MTDEACVQGEKLPTTKNTPPRVRTEAQAVGIENDMGVSQSASRIVFYQLRHPNLARPAYATCRSHSPRSRLTATWSDRTLKDLVRLDDLVVDHLHELWWTDLDI